MTGRSPHRWKGVCIYRPSVEQTGAGMVPVRGLGAVRYREGCEPAEGDGRRPDPRDMIPSAPLRRLWMEPAIERSGARAGALAPETSAEQGAGETGHVPICNPDGVAEVVHAASGGRRGAWLLLLDPLTRPVGVVPIDMEDAALAAGQIAAVSLLAAADTSILVLSDRSSPLPEGEDPSHVEMMGHIALASHVFDVPIRDLVLIGSDGALSHQGRVEHMARDNERTTGRKAGGWLTEEMGRGRGTGARQ